jgi:hypothetical protein
MANITNKVLLNYDSMEALVYNKDPKYHGRTEHINIIYNFIWDTITQNKMILQNISTSHVVVDPLTKLIPRDVFKAYVRELGLYRFWSLY